MSRFIKLHAWNAVSAKRGEAFLVNKARIKTVVNVSDRAVLVMSDGEQIPLDCTVTEMTEWLEADYKIGKIK